MARTRTAKPERLEARISAETKELLTTAATLQGQTLTDFVVVAASESARRVIAQSQAIELSARDQTAFAQSLLEPPPANARLKRAAAEYAAMVASDD